MTETAGRSALAIVRHGPESGSLVGTVQRSGKCCRRIRVAERQLRSGRTYRPLHNWRLIGDYVFRLRTLLTLRHIHGDLLAFLQRLEAFHLN